MATCSASLLTAAAGLDGLEIQQLLAIIACQLATQNGMSCDPQTLMNSAACLTCLTAEQLLAIIACNAGSGGGSAQVISYAGGAPPNPANTAAAALAYPAGGGAVKEWNIATQAWM